MFDYLSGCYFCKICCQNSDLNYIYAFEGGYFAKGGFYLVHLNFWSCKMLFADS